MVRLQILSKDEKSQIHQLSLEILEHVGVIIKNDLTRNLLSDAGCTVKKNLVKFPEKLVTEFVRKAPGYFALYNRNGEHVITVGKDEVLYNPGSSVSYFMDSKTGKIRKAVTGDLIDTILLTDGLEYIAAQSTALIPSDVPDTVADFYRLYLILKYSAKPVITGAFRKDGVKEMAKLLEVFVPDDELRKKPFAIFDCCPLSPLTWEETSAQNLLDCAKMGIPAEIVPAPLIGATSPITLAGTLAQMNAEILSGIVITQLVNPGTPVIYGGAPAPLDMRYATPSYGAIETVMVACAAAEMGKYYGLPTHSYLGVSDAKTIDAQLGLESGVGLVLGAAARINVISGPGTFMFINCLSLEKLVIDNEICGSAMRLTKGISFDGLQEILDVVRAVGHSGNFLAQKHTSRKLRTEHFMPSKIIDRKTEDNWKGTGEMSIVERAREQVKELLENSERRVPDVPARKNLEMQMKELLNKHNVKLSE